LDDHTTITKHPRCHNATWVGQVQATISFAYIPPRQWFLRRLRSSRNYVYLKHNTVYVVIQPSLDYNSNINILSVKEVSLICQAGWYNCHEYL